METTANYSFMPGDEVLPGARFVNLRLPDGARCVFDRAMPNPDFKASDHMEPNPEHDLAKPAKGQPPRLVPRDGAPPMVLELEPLERVMTHEAACTLEQAGYTLKPPPRSLWEAQRREEIAAEGAQAQPGDHSGEDSSSTQPDIDTGAEGDAEDS